MLQANQMQCCSLRLDRAPSSQHKFLHDWLRMSTVTWPTGRQLCTIRTVMILCSCNSCAMCKCCVCMQEDQAIAALGIHGSRRQSSFLIMAEDAATASRFVENLEQGVLFPHGTVLLLHSFGSPSYQHVLSEYRHLHIEHVHVNCPSESTHPRRDQTACCQLRMIGLVCVLSNLADGNGKS